MPSSKTVQQQPAPSTCRIALTIVVALVETLLFSGLIYGIVSLVPMLESRGVYGHLCRNSSAADTNSTLCSSVVQDQMTLAFTVAQVVNPFVSLGSGFLLDKLGFRVVKAVAAAVFGLGCLCFTLVQPGVDWLLFPGTTLIGISGVQVLVSNMQLSPMVKIPFVITSLMNGMFDACSMVASSLVLISKSGVSSFLAFGVYTGIGVATIILTIVIYPGKYSLMEIKGDENAGEDSKFNNSVKVENQESMIELTETHMAVEDVQKKIKPSGTLRQQLLSTDFFLMLWWMICNFLRLNYFIVSLSAYVQLISCDKQQVEYYVTIFGYFFLGNPVVALLSGALLDLQKRFVPALRQSTPRAYKLNTVTNLSLTGLIGIASCLLLLPNNTSVLIPAYIVIAVHKNFIFSTLGNYCLSAFLPQYFGVIFTLILCVSAPFLFLTVPLTNWLKESQNPSLINGIMAALTFASLLHPLILLLRNLHGQKNREDARTARCLLFLC